MREQSLRRIERAALLLVCLATLLSLVLWDRAVFLGVGLGGGLAALNFIALRRILGALFTAKESNPQRGALMGAMLVLKFLIMALSIFLVVKFVPVDAIALLVGISVVVLAIFVEGINSIIRSNQQVNTHGRS